MNRYEVTYESGLLTTGDMAGIPQQKTDVVEADKYATQDTNGAGLIADFFIGNSVRASFTFSKVSSVKKLPPAGIVNIPLEEADATWLQHYS